MDFLTAVLLLAAVDCSLQYALEPELAWPEEYHFNAEEIDMDTRIVKPFEIWYSTEHNRSRIDLYGGTVSRFYYAPKDPDSVRGRAYMIHPEVAEDDLETEIKCDVIPRWSDQKDFLPDLYDFEYKGTEEHDGKQVHVWTRSEELEDVIRKDETLLVMDLDGGVGIPLHHYTKTWNEEEGSLTGHTVINYYNYDDNVPEDVLDAEQHESCGNEWRRFTDDFYEAVKVLHPTIETDVDLAFHRFKRHHSRNYADAEHSARRTIFKRNWNFIVNHNWQKLGYTLGLNQFADKTMSELSYLNGVKKPKPVRGTHPFLHSEEELATMVEDFPKDFDLRSLGVISPVINQAHCGSCWAFAMASTLEGAFARKNGGRLVDLSEQSLVDCAWAFKSHGCGGTEDVRDVYEYVLKHGIPTVEEYGPYLEEDGFCKINNMTNIYTIKGYTGVTKNSENALKAAIYNNGPVTIAILVTERMMYYRSGVFYDTDCPPDPEAMNHAVTLVGYGERDGDLYWIVKNSWGESWGESGYVLMKASNNNCNVMTSPYYAIL